MELDQLIPEQATWERKLKGENNETRTLNLAFRPFDLEDEAWLKRAFGDSLKHKFETMDMEAISRIAFHQLENESKKELMNITFMGWDEENDVEVEVAKTGREKLGKLCLGYPDQLELLKILLKVRGFSMPVVEEIAGEKGDEGNSEKPKRVTKKKTSSRKRK